MSDKDFKALGLVMGVSMISSVVGLVLLFPDLFLTLTLFLCFWLSGWASLLSVGKIGGAMGSSGTWNISGVGRGWAVRGRLFFCSS